MSNDGNEASDDVGYRSALTGSHIEQNSSSSANKQAKKRTVKYPSQVVLLDESPYSPTTKYSIGTTSRMASHRFSMYVNRHRVPLAIIGFISLVTFLYFFLFFLDSEYESPREPLSSAKIIFNLPEDRSNPVNSGDNNNNKKQAIEAVKPVPLIIPEPDTIDDYLKSFDMDNSPNKVRRTGVREAMKHAYNNYAALVWGRDELKPISRTFHNWVVNGMGMTTLDSLDTLFIMGLKDEYARAQQYVAKEMPRFEDIDTNVSLFETTIRVLGGLLSAYDLSHDKVFLERAKSMGDRLLPAFGSNSGVPYAQINLRTSNRQNFAWNGGCSVLSEFGTLQLEFRRLSEVTGDSKYDRAVTKVMDVMEKHSTSLTKRGLYPVGLHPDSNTFCSDHITLGAYGDSFYEYLLKQWIMSNGRLNRYKVMFEESVNGIINYLLVKPKKNWYISEMRGGQRVNKIDHLVCFASGMFALAYATNATRNSDMLEIGKQFGKTCYESYIMTSSGLGPETFSVNDDSGEIYPGVRTYLLRPETVESIFILYRVTGDEMYRDWGWKIFQAIEKHCRVEKGYSGVADVMTVPVQNDDFQQSFFLAETLKYLYLLFSPRNVIPLDKWVFNTEAHPFRITI